MSRIATLRMAGQQLKRKLYNRNGGVRFSDRVWRTDALFTRNSGTHYHGGWRRDMKMKILLGKFLFVPYKIFCLTVDCYDNQKHL